jgi:hypothetical protein
VLVSKNKKGSIEIVEAAVVHLHLKGAVVQNQIIKRGTREEEIKNLMINTKKHHQRKK